MLGEWSVGRNISGMDKLTSYLSTAWRLRKSDIDAVVIEGTTPSVLMAPLIGCCNRRKKSVIALCADDALYRTFVQGNRLMQILTWFSFNFISGIVAVGDLTTKLAREHLKPLPIEVRYPPIAKPKVNEMAVLKPSLDWHTIILIGSGSAYVKGVDIATRCLEILQEKFPDARLTILGLPEVKERPGLTVPGAVADIRPYLSEASVLIHPGRGDAFPVVILESMLAGVVPFLSEWTGALSIAHEVDPNLVVPLNAEEFAERIGTFWSASPEHRQTLSNKCKQVAKEFTAKTAAQPSLRPFIERVAATKKSRG
ncbi:MAG: glycosyltransferase [Candidatus Aquicultor sp.]